MSGVSLPVISVMTVIFVAVTIFLGYYGYRHTGSNQDYLLGKNKTNHIIIGLSYGATFLSASAVIGFGGQAATHGLGLMWLCFLNLFVGLLVAFVVFGPRTRKIGKKLKASTFADLLGKMYKSPGIRVFTAVLIIIMMPVYCAAVLKGAVNSVAVITGHYEIYNIILIVLAIIIGLYVVFGGIIAVMYNDALQAGIMFLGLVVILVLTFTTLGGVSDAFSSLQNLDTSQQSGVLPGFNGWTNFASFGSQEWMLVVSTFILGVGLGVLTQPQLVVRFMSAKDDKMLNRSLIIGSIFMLVIVGSAYTCGALSNVYFFNEHGLTSQAYIDSLGLGTDFIFPQFVLEMVNNDVFVSLFLLCLVCASVSTIAALMHTIGTARGYDIYTVYMNWKGKFKGDSSNLRFNRIVTAIMMVLVVIYCYIMPNDIIAKATSLFMGITASALLPAYCHGLYAKERRDTRAAKASIVVGTVTYMFWALFINKSDSMFLPICKLITGKQVLFDGNIALCDPLLVALPLSILTMLVVWFIGKYRPVKETAAA